MLLGLGLLDIGPREALDGLTRSAREVNDYPAAAQSVASGGRLRFKSQQGAAAQGLLQHGALYAAASAPQA